MIHLDNFRVHNSKIAQKKIKECRLKHFPHPPYLHDLAPSDFFLFEYVKDQLKGCKFIYRASLEMKITQILRSFLSINQFDHYLKW